jgi:uncharacterized protein (DUF433 family)
MIDYRAVITLEPGKRGGKPCIRGLRITVQDVLEWLANGMSLEDILTDYPELVRNDVLACLAYAAEQERRGTKISYSA